MTLKKTFSTMLLAAILCAPFTVSAQVTIGSDRAPSQWSLLDLCTREQQRALHNARMDTEQRDSLMNEDWQPATERIEAQGLMIFNTDNDGCLEFWSGSRWVSLCEGDTPCYRIASINHLPTSREVTVNVDNTTATLTVTPVGGTPPFEFQWFDSNGRIDDATDSIFTTLNNLSAGAHTFYAVITNCEGARTRTSELFTVIVTCYPINSVLHNGQAIPQVINKQPGATAARLEVAPVGGSAPHNRVQWFSNNTNSNIGGIERPVNATSLVYTTQNNLPAGRHYFFAEIWNCDNTYSIRSEVFVVNVRDFLGITPEGTGYLSGAPCFDIGWSNPGGRCVPVAERENVRRSFVLNNTEIYTLTAPANIENLTFEFVNSQTTAVIDSIRPLAGNQVRVYFNPQLDSLARYRNRGNALRADLHAIFDIPGRGERRQSITLSVRDCFCCPGLFIPDGAWTARPEFINAQGNLNMTANMLFIPNLFQRFDRNGMDLCFYYRDFSSDTNISNSNAVNWNVATNNGNDMYWVCGNRSNSHLGQGVDAVHTHGDWRIPTLAELAQIVALVSNNTTSSSNTRITQAMVDAALALPDGSVIEHYRIFNLRRVHAIYWSGTRLQFQLNTAPGVISFDGPGVGQRSATSFEFMRCVRSF